MPRSIIWPSRSTMIWSASFTVEMRCAIRIVVRWRMTSRSPRRMRSSVSVSTLDRESSSTRIRGWRRMARASDVRCFCPPDKRDSALADHCVEASGETLNFSGDARDLDRFEDVLLGGVFDAEGDVFAQCFAEEKRILRHVSNGPAQCLERILADGATVDQHGSGRSFPQARNQRSERGFSASRGADDGQGRTGRDTQIDVVQDRGARRAGRPGRIGERQMAEFDLAANVRLAAARFVRARFMAPAISAGGALRRFGSGRRRVLNVWLGIQHVIQPAHRSRAPLENIRHEADRDHRENKLDQE